MASQSQEPDGQDTLHRVQRALTVIIKEFDRVCAELGLRWVTYGGTALGAVRHHGFIPWDDDADVAMTRQDYERFMAEAPAVLGDEFSIQNARTAEDYPNMFSKLALTGTLFVPEPVKDYSYRMPLALDIFPLDVVAPTKKLYRAQSRQAWFWGRAKYLIATPRPYLEMSGPAKKVILAGTTVAHGLLNAAKISPRSAQNHWETAARRFEHSGGALMADFTDLHPLSWAATEDDLYPALDVPFDGITVKVPRNYDTILTHAYGDYMQLPPEDQRKTHEPSEIDLGAWADVDDQR